MAYVPRPGRVSTRAMSPDTELLVIFGVLHLAALVLGGALFLMFLRSDSSSSWSQDDEDDSGGGGNDRISDKPKTSPSGGIPLPFSVQSDRRLRSSHDKLADPGCRRVRTRKPAEPARAGGCPPAAPPSPRGRGACPATCRPSADRHQRLGGLVPALDVAPGRLA